MAFDPQQYLDQKTAAPTNDGSFDPQAYLAQKTGAGPSANLPTIAPTPGVLESLARGAEQGATLGWGDEINGGLEALLDAYKGNSGDLIDNYIKHRDESRQLMKDAEAAHPTASLIGNLAGGLGTALATGGGSLAEEGVAGAAKLGAGIGAISGLGNSDSDNLGGQLKDAAVGAGLGGGLGLGTGIVADKFAPQISGALQNIGAKVGGGLKNIGGLESLASPTEAFLQGFGGTADNPNGRVLFGKRGAQSLRDELINAFGQSGAESDSSVGGYIQDELNKAQNAKKDILTNQMTDNGEIDMTPWLKTYDTLSGALDQSVGDLPGIEDQHSQIKNLINSFFKVDPETGEYGTTSLTPARAEILRDMLGSLGSAADSPVQSPYVRALVNRLMSPLTRDPNLQESLMQFPTEGLNPLKSVLESSMDGLSDANSRISALTKASNELPSISQALSSERQGIGGTSAQDAVRKLTSTLPDDMSGPVTDQIKDLGQAVDVYNKIAAPGLSHGLLGNSIRGAALTGANALGLGTRALYDMTPEAITSLASQISSLGTDASAAVGNILSAAAGKDRIGRNALIFAMQQNPAYREVLRQATGEDAK